MVKVLIKIFLPFFLGSFFVLWAFSFASADEISLVPVDTFEIYVESSYNGYTSQQVLETEYSVNQYPFNDWYDSQDFALGSSWSIPDLPSSTVYLYNANGSLFYRYTPVTRCAYEYYGYDMRDFYLQYNNFVIGLDLSGQLDGYFRYTCDFFIGASFVVDPFQYTSGNYDLTPTYTYNSVPLAIPDSANGMHCIVYLIGEQDYSYKQGSNSTVTCSLIHLRLESTFYYDSAYGSEVVFNLQPVFQSMLGSLNYDCSSIRGTGRSQSVNAYFNSRVFSSLFSNVVPPVTPTPTVTPYPGQDTQESINQGVSNIEGQMNQLINSLNPVVSPIPTPADFTIDETLFDELESMTLPDVSAAEDTFSSLWDIFNPIWWLLALLFSVTFVIGIFLYVLRGGFI